MSEAVSALQGASYRGQVAIREAGLRGMITLRGDLGSDEVRKAASEIAGVEFPDRRGAGWLDGKGLCWMSPDEVLIVLPRGEVGVALDRLASALAGHHHLAVDVSDARAVFALEGEPGAMRDVLAKLTPADLSASALPVGEIRRTRLAQVSAAIWFQDESRAEVICFRSVAQYVFDLLRNAADPGSEVGYF